MASSPSTAAQVPPHPMTSLVRLLYTQNPFYLIGTFLVIFGLQQSLGNDREFAVSGMLVTLIACYTLLLAGVAAIIIRGGQVWDDARTILLVIVLLFFMLSTALDVHLLYEPAHGTLLQMLGLIFSIVVSEGVLRGLRIHLAARYRGPYYLMLTLLFVYPVALTWISRYDMYELLSWAIFAFSACAALTLLTLLPAARTRRTHEPASGTPWVWPYYPWSLFIFLTVGFAIRTWWIAMAFEPTEGTTHGFQAYFLIPLVLAWSALVLEMGRSHASRPAIACGMALPLASLLLAMPGSETGVVSSDFLARLCTTIGSPVQLTIGGIAIFYSWAWLRGVRAAEGLLLLAGALASIVDAQTLSWWQLTLPNPTILAGLAAAMIAAGLIRRTSWRVAAGTCLLLIGMQATRTLETPDTLFWQNHALALCLLAIAVLFNDRLARWMRDIAWPGIPLAALAGAVIYPWTLADSSAGTHASYLLLLLLLALGCWARDKHEYRLAAVGVVLLANLLAQVQQGYALLEATLLSRGLPYLTAGLFAVLLGFGISLLKMGLWREAWEWLRRVNRALGGC